MCPHKLHTYLTCVVVFHPSAQFTQTRVDGGLGAAETEKAIMFADTQAKGMRECGRIFQVVHSTIIHLSINNTIPHTPHTTNCNTSKYDSRHDQATTAYNGVASCPTVTAWDKSADPSYWGPASCFEATCVTSCVVTKIQPSVKLFVGTYRVDRPTGRLS